MTINVQAFRILYRATQACPEAQFDMRHFAHQRGTPACLLGNYAASPEQNEFVLCPDGFIDYHCGDHDEAWIHHAGTAVCEHFGIKYVEACELFGKHGAGGRVFNDDDYGHCATKAEALDYVRAFCAERGVDVTTE